MSNSIVAQIPKNLMFRYRIVCKKFESEPSKTFELSDQYLFPSFSAFEGQFQFADLRVGWCQDGLFLSSEVTKKQQSLWCRESQLLDSDGIQIWVDTRDTHNVHRASKFCHWIVLLPAGGGVDGKKPHASMLKINRSKDDSPSINRHNIVVDSKITKEGYKISAFIPGKALNGWDTNDHRMLGFNFSVVDRELGRQTLAVGPELPISEDPSLWQTIELVD